LRLRSGLAYIGGDEDRGGARRAATIGLGVRVLASAFLALAFSGASAQALTVHKGLISHKYIGSILEVPAGNPEPGSLSNPEAVTADSGDLWLAEVGGSVDAFDASFSFEASSFNSGAFIEQFPVVPSLGQTNYGIAVGHATGEREVYVGAFPGTAAVGVFGPSGVLQATWTGADTPSGSFGEGFTTGVTVDDSPSGGDWAKGDVFVSAESVESHGVVDIFSPEAGGKEPAKVVAQLKLTGDSPNEPLIESIRGLTVSAFNGDLIVTGFVGGTNVVDVFAPAGLGEYSFVKSLALPNGGTLRSVKGGVAVDGSNGDIYVLGTDQETVGVETVDTVGVFEFEPSGVYVGRITEVPSTGGPVPAHDFNEASADGVAVDPGTGRVFVLENGHQIAGGEVSPSAIFVFGPNLVKPDVTTEPASDVRGVSATLHGLVDPRNAGEDTCRFAWGTSLAFGHVEQCSGEGSSEKPIANGNVAVGVEAHLSGLEPDTTYFYRLEASNGNGTNEGEASQNHEFTTLGPGMHGEFVSDLASRSVTLDARIDPHGEATSYRFEYYAPGEEPFQCVTKPSPSNCVPVDSENIGSGEGDVGVEQHVQGLLPDTIYHYRVVVTSKVAPGEMEEFDGLDQIFITQSVVSAPVLLDGRAWELVSPVDKHGAVISSIETRGAVTQSAASGDAFTYLANTPTEADPQGYRELEQVLSSRSTVGWCSGETATGWCSKDISTSHAVASGVNEGHGEEYRFFSGDLSSALVEPVGAFTSLEPEAFPPDTGHTQYLRHDSTCQATPSTCYLPLLTDAPGYEDVPSGTKFSGESEAVLGNVEFVDGTPDLAHVILASDGVALTGTPLSNPKDVTLYEWSAGRPPGEALQLVSELPKGTAVEGLLGAGPSRVIHDTQNAVSVDGSRVFWTGNDGHLYLRDTVRGETVQLDALQPGAAGASETAAALYQFASNDGSRVFFTDRQRLTEHAGKNGSDLYECVIVTAASGDECVLSDLTAENGDESAGVQGGVGVSEDGSYVYFVASGVLTSVVNEHQEQPVAGGENLYVSHYNQSTETWEGPTFIAALSSEDEPDWAQSLAYHTSRVSPDGRFVAFMSDRSVTGYDNEDVTSLKRGERPDEEVYLFDALTGRLVCASCDPTDARPEGVEYGYEGENMPLTGGGGRQWPEGAWLAANVPAGTPFAGSTAAYQSRYLSDSGRLFFNSHDGLVAGDINHNQDVYEYEPAGIGDCSTSLVSFDEASGGCVSLISSGTSSVESAFLDASETGDDVFFLTGEQLVKEDVDGSLDVYDAHVCTSQSPCASEPVERPACVTPEACRGAPAAQPSIFGAPASATFSGVGNVSPPVVAGVVKKSLTRAQKLARALSACHKKKNKHKRAACERQERKRYAAKPSRKAKTTKNGRG
jgi:hypothetical protein